MIEVFRSKLADLHRIPGQKVLDVGGGHAPCRQATHIVDIMPYESLKQKPAPKQILCARMRSNCASKHR